MCGDVEVKQKMHLGCPWRLAIWRQVRAGASLWRRAVYVLCSSPRLAQSHNGPSLGDHYQTITHSRV